MRPDFLYEVQGGLRPLELARRRRPTQSQASTQGPRGCRRSAVSRVVGGFDRCPMGASCGVSAAYPSTAQGRSKLWGKDSLRLAEQVVACDRPTVGSRAQGRPGGRPFVSTAGPAEGGVRRRPGSTAQAPRRPADRSCAERPDHAQARPVPRRPQAAVRTRPRTDRDDQDASNSATSGTSRNARSRSSTIRARSVVRSLPLCPRESIRPALPAAASGSFASA